LPLPVDRVGAVAEDHLIAEFQVIALAELSCITLRVAADTFPLAAGLVKLTVVSSVKVWLKLLAVCKLRDTALLVEVTAAYSSLKPLSKVTTPLASAVTTLLASDNPSVVTSL